LLEAVAGLRVIAYEDGFEPGSATTSPRFVQRIVALRETPGSTGPARHELAPAGQVKSADSED
jgi:hypothetical protein